VDEVRVIGTALEYSAARLGGTESLDYPFEVRPGVDVSDATVTFIDPPTGDPYEMYSSAFLDPLAALPSPQRH
jgi:hypothetical protein